MLFKVVPFKSLDWTTGSVDCTPAVKPEVTYWGTFDGTASSYHTTPPIPRRWHCSTPLSLQSQLRLVSRKEQRGCAAEPWMWGNVPVWLQLPSALVPVLELIRWRQHTRGVFAVLSQQGGC